MSLEELNDDYMKAYDEWVRLHNAIRAENHPLKRLLLKEEQKKLNVKLNQSYTDVRWTDTK